MVRDFVTSPHYPPSPVDETRPPQGILHVDMKISPCADVAVVNVIRPAAATLARPLDRPIQDNDLTIFGIDPDSPRRGPLYWD